jgi:predicted acetyltransferase
MTSGIDIEALGPSDRELLLAIDQSAFAFDGRDLDPVTDTAWIEWDRAYRAVRGGTPAGIYAVFSLGLAVPGRPPQAATPVPMAGLSWVAVHPDHRRRGVLSAMMGHHLRTVHEGARHEPVSGLFASEPAIYGRFGYGIAAETLRVTLPAKSPLRAPRDPGGVATRFEPVDPDRHAAIVQEVYEEVVTQRPGHSVRPPAHSERQLADPAARRPSGAEALKVLIAERRGRPTGYALLRRTASYGSMTQGTLRIADLQAKDPQSAHALWRRSLDFDLMAEVVTPPLPADDPLLVWAGESVASRGTAQTFWLRLVDVPAALGMRGYREAVDVVLAVTDELCPWNAGRWRLSADPAGARCHPTSDAADLVLDVRELGSVYLGGVTFETLARAGSGRGTHAWCGPRLQRILPRPRPAHYAVPVLTPAALRRTSSPTHRRTRGPPSAGSSACRRLRQTAPGAAVETVAGGVAPDERA